MTDPPVSRSVILGLDGIPWDLMSRWLTPDRLPNLSRLASEGASGPLESTVPPTTAVAWPSIATGVRADKHGIYGFRRLTSEYGWELNTSASLRHPTIWEVCSPSVVVNVPMTYPATPIDGTMVTGMMTPRRDDGFTHPTAFRDELDDVVPDYEIGLAWHEYHDRESTFLEDLERMVSVRQRLLFHLIESREWSIFFFVFTAPDRLQHLIWDESIIEEQYARLDAIVGDVMDVVEQQDANLFVVSDHGFGPVHESVHVNTVLEDGGYLTRRTNTGRRGVLESIGLTKDSVRSVLDRLRLDEALFRLLPQQVIESVAREIPGEHTLFDVDFTRTTAFGCNGQALYINDQLRFENGIVPQTDREPVKTEIQRYLASLRHPDTGEPLFRVYDGSELFPTDPQAPDLVVEVGDGAEVKTDLSDERITETTDRAANHHSTGTFLAWGPNIDSTRVSGATVFDVTPTVLHSQLHAIPRDVDGDVLEIFSDAAVPASEPPTFADFRSGPRREVSDQDFDSVEDRLRGLGYLD